jgi:uncharacterized membrane protein (UPF0182 family)
VSGGFLYVESIYIQATEARMPQLKKVVLAMGNRLIYRDTFGEALAELTAAPRLPRLLSPRLRPPLLRRPLGKAYPGSLNASTVFGTRPNNWPESWRR